MHENIILTKPDDANTDWGIFFPLKLPRRGELNESPS